MEVKGPTWAEKLVWSLPWLARYPFWRVRELIRRATKPGGTEHIILIVANHFEPSWTETGAHLDVRTQARRLDQWCAQARAIGNDLRDCDGTPFRHTNFYPGEQYHRPLLERLAELQAEGFGEVEIHLHHGVEQPDTAPNLRRALVEFRDVLAEEHQCLSRIDGEGPPRYAFVHGNWALANSAGGRFCGVDTEMQILAETGCYADLTLPSAPDQSQVARINAIYECGRPLDKARPHRTGPGLRVGRRPALPVILTGPLGFDWSRRKYGIPLPRLEDSALTANSPLTIERFGRWRKTHIAVEGRPDWVFVKLFCHGFFDFDQPVVIGEDMRRFLDRLLALSAREGDFRLHFASAREAFNIAMAAVDGHSGDPGQYRDYRLRQIMQANVPATAAKTGLYRAG